MNKKLIILCVIILSAFCCYSQEQPTSKIINARQLLDDLKYLSADEMLGRAVGTEGSEKARDYILKRFKDSKIEPFGKTYLHPFDFSRQRTPNEKLLGTNILGFIKGKKHSNKFIVVTAHYDHIGVQKGVVYNGANDNASGTSALFALAEYFSKNKPQNSILFVAFDAEEVGLIGAKKFFENLPVNKESIILNINLDMICRDKQDKLFAVGTYHYPYLKPFLEKVASRSKVKLLFGYDVPNLKNVEDWTFSSDHAAFHREKIPFIYFGVEDFENHHKASDDYETITPLFFINSVETIIDSIREFDKNLIKIENKKLGKS